jgi:hypothetical protein
MAVSPEPLRAVPVPGVPILDKRCPDRIEVNADDRVVTAVQIKAWVAHLRSHGWTDKELGLIWLSRARQGVTRQPL